MRFDLGALIMVVTLTFMVWGVRKLRPPARRQPGMRIRLSSTKPDEREKESVEP